VLIALTVLSVCDLLNDCGCRPIWAGAASHCDIHVRGAPDCPWCIGPRFMFIATAMILGALAAIVAVSRKLTERFWALVLAGVAAYLVVAVLAKTLVQSG
jgi:hypothetical protein